MKTAMELALARIELTIRFNYDDIHWIMFKNDCMEKEKKQIVESFESGYKSCDIDEAFEINSKLASGEQYYNQKYQNKTL